MNYTISSRKNRCAQILLAFFVSIANVIGAPIVSSDSTSIDSLVYLENEVVVSALRYEGYAFDLPQSISVLNDEQLALFAPMSMPDALAEVPGVWMQKTNLGGGSPFVRGLTGYQVLLLIDGIRFNNSTFRSGPNQYLNTIDPFLLTKVEVVRGQGSVQYGSDAIGGAINIFSKEPQYTTSDVELHGSFYGKYMSHDMERIGRGTLELRSRSSSLYVGGTYKSFGDVVAGGSLGTLIPTGYNEYSVDVKLKQRINKNQEVIGAYQHHNLMHVPLYHKVVSGEYSTYEFDPQRRDLGYLRWKIGIGNKVFKSLTYTASWQNSLEVRKKQKVGEPVFRTERDEVQTIGNTLELISAPATNLLISSGLEFYHDNIYSSATELDGSNDVLVDLRGLYPDNSKANNLAIYILSSISLPHWNFSAGARYNYIDLRLKDNAFGDVIISPDALVGNIGAVYKLSENCHFTASVSSGFRAPNINDVSSFGEADFRYEVPNYDLLPEKSLTIDLGWKVRSQHFSSNLHVYQNYLTNLITNVRSQYMGQDSINNLQVYTRINANKAMIYGVEANVNYKVFSQLQLYASLTYTYGQNISANEPMRRIPPLFGTIGSTYNIIDRLKVRIDWKHANEQSRLSQGDKDDSRIPTGGSKAWNVFGCSAHYIQEHYTIRAGVANIFDKAYRVHGSGIDGPSRSFWIALKLNF